MQTLFNSKNQLKAKGIQLQGGLQGFPKEHKASLMSKCCDSR